jgi:hypothetical protein
VNHLVIAGATPDMGSSLMPFTPRTLIAFLDECHVDWYVAVSRRSTRGRLPCERTPKRIRALNPHAMKHAMKSAPSIGQIIQHTAGQIVNSPNFLLSMIGQLRTGNSDKTWHRLPCLCNLLV